MKRLISVETIKQAVKAGEKHISLDKDTIITAAARDMASEKGISFVKPDAGGEDKPQAIPDDTVKPATPQVGIDSSLVSLIVSRVLSQLGAPAVSKPVDVVDSTGFRLVQGATAFCEPFTNGSMGDRVKMKDLITTDNDNKAPVKAGFLTLEASTFPRELTCDEIHYIVEGTLEVTIGEKTYRGKLGDVVYIPSNTKIIFASPGYTKLFYVTCPAN